MSYPTGMGITYTAVATSQGYLPGDHSYSWSFDDSTTASGATTSKTWNTTGDHSATVTATNTVTGVTATASKTIALSDFTFSPASGVMPNNVTRAIYGVMPNGKILITGGLNRSSSQLFTTYEYDGSTFVQTGNCGLASYQAGSYHPRIVVRPDGKMMKFGSIPESTGTEVYDPVTQTWSAGKPMNSAITINSSAPIVLNDGRIFIPEGVSGGLGTGSSRIYNLATDTWTTVPGSGFTSEGSATPCLMADGNVFYGIYGGSTRYRCYIFNTTNNTITNYNSFRTDTPSSSIDSAILGSDGWIYCLNRSGNIFRKFDPVGHTFTNLTAPGSATSGSCYLVSSNGGRYIIVIGIYNGTTYGTRVFDVGSATWSSFVADGTGFLKTNAETISAGMIGSNYYAMFSQDSTTGPFKLDT